MGSASTGNLQDAVDFFELYVQRGEDSGKLSFEAADTARQSSLQVEEGAGGWFSSDEDEAIAYWAGMDEACKGWLMTADERGYLATIIQGQISSQAKEEAVEAEAEYGAQIQEKAEKAAQKAEDVLVDTGKDPSLLWGVVGGIVGGLLGGPMGAAYGFGIGFAGGKAKKAGLV